MSMSFSSFVEIIIQFSWFHELNHRNMRFFLYFWQHCKQYSFSTFLFSGLKVYNLFKKFKFLCWFIWVQSLSWQRLLSIFTVAFYRLFQVKVRVKFRLPRRVRATAGARKRGKATVKGTIPEYLNVKFKISSLLTH